jgi:phage shock protein C
MKRLFKSTKDKKLEGVCAGIAEYAGMDPTVVRVLFVVGTFITGILPGTALYVVLAIIMPRADGT